ncbi:MAG: molybdate ABC transporter permease subunit [Sarcina sp.]
MIIEALIISLKVSVVSTILVSVIGIALARLFLRKKNFFTKIIEGLIMLPLFLPPSLIGYGIIILLGKKSIIGSFLYESLGFSFIFTIYGAIIATFIVSFPIIYETTKGALLSIDKSYEETAMDLGANRRQAFFKIILPMSYKQILSGVILSFARAFGEFGATMMVAGNIVGKTQTIPIALYYSVEYGESTKATMIACLILVISITLIYFYNKFIK